VTTDLRDFDLIVPCGIEGVAMTSVGAELGRNDARELWTESRRAIVSAFGAVFAYDAVEPDGAERLEPPASALGLT